MFLCSTGNAGEGFWDGNKLFVECSKATKLCDAYLAGLADMAAKEAGVALPSAAVCFPEGTSLQRLREVVLKQLKDHPQGRGGARGLHRADGDQGDVAVRQ